jgi:type IV secretion system protein VirD4
MSAIRFLLIITILLTVYVAVTVSYVLPYAWVGAVALVLVAMCKKTYRFSAYGTARWATVVDLPHMLEGMGLIIGYIAGKPSRIAGVKALFNSRLSARVASERFLQSCRKKKPENLVRLTHSIHSAIFAPTGVGKGVSCIIPYLLTCPESYSACPQEHGAQGHPA